jgi:hypothetical protein
MSRQVHSGKEFQSHWLFAFLLVDRPNVTTKSQRRNGMMILVKSPQGDADISCPPSIAVDL